MATATHHEDLGNGRVREYYDDGSFQEWDIDTGDHPTYGWGNGGQDSGGGSSGGSGGGGGGGGGGSSSSGSGGKSSEDLSPYEQQVIDSYREASGFSRDQLAAQVKADKAKLDFQYEQLKKLGIPQLKLDTWYKREQIKIAQKAQEIDQQKFMLDVLKTRASLGGPADYFQAAQFSAGVRDQGLMNGKATFLQRLQDGEQTPAFTAPGGTPTPQTMSGLAGDLGVQGLAPAAAAPPVQGPDMHAAPAPPGAEVPRADPTPAAVSAQQNGTMATAVPAPVPSGILPPAVPSPTPSGQLPPALGTALATPTTTTMASAQGTAAAPAASDPLQLRADRDATNLNAIGDIGAAGAQKLAPGTLESQDQDDLALLTSGLKMKGFSAPRFFRDYTRSRPNQGSAQAA